MQNFDHASEIVQPHEKTVVIFTRGQHLKFNDQGVGESGKWVIKQNRLDDVKKVIMYLRGETTKINQLYLGDYLGNHPSDRDGRLVVEFANLNVVGTTQNNWPSFATGNQTPIGIINK